MNRKFTIYILTVFFALNCAAQNFKKKFDELNSAGDTTGQISLLMGWEKKLPADPELYVAYYNYYVHKSASEMITLERDQKGKNSLRFTDSAGNEAGFINDVVGYGGENLNKGFWYIDKGISIFPDRLDMRFGKIYLLGEIRHYREFTEEIIKTIDRSAINKNAWLWSDNKPQEDGKNAMLSSIQSYVLQLYNTNDDALLDNMKNISLAVLKYYPDHVESLSDISIVYMLHDEYDKALEALLKAEKIAPKDFIVLNNIAHAYKMKKDIPNAKKYYQLTLQYGDAEAQQEAKEELTKLK